LVKPSICSAAQRQNQEFFRLTPIEPVCPCAGLDFDVSFIVTFFADRAARSKDLRDLTAPKLVELIRSTAAPSKQGLPWLKLAVFGDTPTDTGCLRHDANVDFLCGAMGDYDGERVPIDRAAELMASADLDAILYSSPSSTPAKPRWRIICPFRRPWVYFPDEWPDVHEMMTARVNGALGGILADESFTLSQSYYFGRALDNQDADFQVIHIRGRFLDTADDLDENAIGRSGFTDATADRSVTGGGKSRRSAAYWRAVLAGVPQHGIPELGIAGRDKAAASLAGRFLMEVDRDELMPLMQEWNLRNEPPLISSDLRRIVNSIGRRSCR
jgi:hypothetical protein